LPVNAATSPLTWFLSNLKSDFHMRLLHKLSIKRYRTSKRLPLHWYKSPHSNYFNLSPVAAL
jgi:hypothetical protein